MMLIGISDPAGGFMKKSSLLMMAMLATALVIGCAMAADPPKATFETQGIKTVTSVSVSGTFTNSATMVMTTAENSGGVNSAPLDAGGRQATNVYTEFTEGKNGVTDYSRTFTADTANKVLGTNNVESHRSIQFVADPTKNGRMTSSEKIIMDIVGAPGGSTEDSMLCPFGAGASSEFPAFCNIVQAGSSFDVTNINVVTDATLRDIQATADFPAELYYSINAKGNVINGILYPATGSITAFMDVHTQEARGDGILPEADFTYKEETTASGYINSFVKTMYYQDGALRI
jgi:hypothetical protein